MSVLIIDEETTALVRRVIEYATAPRNHYIVLAGGKSFQKPPGSNPNHAVQLYSYRCVFSITKTEGKAWRHLSVSVLSRNIGYEIASPQNG